MGENAPVEGTPFDFRKPKAIGRDLHKQDTNEQLRNGTGYDHNFVLNHPGNGEMFLAASVGDPYSGRMMEIYTQEPGLQFYGGNFFDGSDTGKSGAPYKFREAFALIKKLRSEGIVDLELGGKETSWSSPVTVNATGDISQVLLLGAASYAMSNDAEIVGYPDGKWQTHKYEKHMALRFSPAANDSPDAQRLKKLLGLEADRNNFPIVEAEMVNAEKARGILGQSPGALDPSVVWVEIGLRGRSMLEIMQVASKEVRVPGQDVELGIAAANRSPGMQSSNGATDWLVIKSSDSKPSNSSLSIEYRGHWFYIDDRDLQSRETFAMLTALFAVVGGTVPGAHPVLTMPVR